MQLWDTFGEERFFSISKLVCQNADIYVFVYDITQKDSLEKTKKFIEHIKNNFKSDNLFLLGNKNDLNEEKKITKEEVQKFQIENDIKMFREISAKNDSQEYLKNILKVFIKNSNIIYHEENNSNFKLERIPEIKNVGFFEWFCDLFV